MPVESETPSPRQLHQAVHIGLMRCNATQFADAQAVASVADALDRWVSSYPDQARDIERLSLSACYTAARWHEADAAARLGAVGLVASRLRPKPTEEDRASAVLLTLLTAEANLAVGRLREGQHLLDDAAYSISSPGTFGAMAPYVVQRCEVLAGLFSEAALESADAAPHFARALETAEPLLRNRIRLRSLARQWVPMVFGDGPQLLENGEEQAIELLKLDVLQTYRRAALAYARTATDRAEAARTAVDAFIEFGLPGDACTLELRPALLALTASDADARFTELLKKADELDTDRRQAAWKAMIRLAHARVHARSGEVDAFAKAHKESTADLAKAADGMTWTGALADILATTDPTEKSIQLFLMTYGQLITADPVPPLSLPLRVQFDESIGIAGEWAFEELRARPSSSASRTLSLILDALRSPDVHELPFAAPSPKDERGLDGRLKQAYEAALDRLGRLQYAIGRISNSCALVMHTVGNHVFFAAATGDVRAPLVMASAGKEYLDAATNLARALTDAIRDSTFDTTDRVEHFGRAAFDSLPKEIQALLRKRRNIYLLPDFFADREGIPFELFHDSHDFLCLSKVISRSLSLRELVRAVEPPVIRPEHRQRAICLAVAEPDGFPRLQYAVPEVRSVRSVLEGKWDAPDLESASLDATRLLQGIELAGVTHIAAHGTISAGGEALVLNEGERLTVEDINERPRLLGGLIFLNACSLARVRYLGAGASSGIASAFVRAGAPCVIANLLPVEDRSANELAISFYEAAGSRPTGESLMVARKKIAANGAPPSRWGTTVLLGNPQFRIAGGRALGTPGQDAAAELLYRYSVPEKEHADHSDAMVTAVSVLKREPQHVRLRAAVDWVWAASAIDSDASSAEALAAARVARGLDCRPAEGLFLYAAAQTMKDPDHLRGTLDEAIWALEPLAPLNDIWRNMHVEASAQRQKLDARREVPFIDGPLRVNDTDDPAVQAVLQIQHAIDRGSIREQGSLRIRHPERTLADVAWNAVVIGQQDRFHGEDAQAGCAMQIAGKLEDLSLIDGAAMPDVRRVAIGLLSFLWETQRITHLERERALGQSETLRLMIERVDKAWDGETRARLQPLTDAVDALESQAPAGGNKFQRALEALNAAESTPDAVADLESRIRSTLERCAAISPHAQAEAAAWSIGLLLERAHQCLRSQPARATARDQLLQVSSSLSSEMEGWLFPYLMDGYKPVREATFDFVQRWKLTPHQRSTKRRTRKPARVSAPPEGV